MLIDENGLVNSEPGSFGAAWTLAAWAAGRRHGFTRAYHWGWSQVIGTSVNTTSDSDHTETMHRQNSDNKDVENARTGMARMLMESSSDSDSDTQSKNTVNAKGDKSKDTNNARMDRENSANVKDSDSSHVLGGDAWLAAVAELAVGAAVTYVATPADLLPNGATAAGLPASSTAWGLVAVGSADDLVQQHHAALNSAFPDAFLRGTATTPVIVMLSLFEVLGYHTATPGPIAATLAVQVPLPAGVAGANCRSVGQYTLGPHNAIYDVIYRDLAAAGELALTDGRVHPLADMATAPGLGHLNADAAHYLALQNTTLQAVPFAGSVKAHGAPGVTVSVPMALQSVAAVVLEC